MTKREALPALVTFAVLACGLVALDAARLGEWDRALRFVLVAAVLDGIDGALARKLLAAGPLGKQMDSLSDIVAFGVAPAFLFSTYYADGLGLARFGVMFAFVGAGLFRLARYNSMPSSDTFMGLPITIAGVLFAALVAGPLEINLGAAVLSGLSLAVLMVSHLPFPAFHRWRSVLLPALFQMGLAIAIWPRAETVALIAAGLLGSYVVWALVQGFIEQRAHDGSDVADDVRA